MSKQRFKKILNALLSVFLTLNMFMQNISIVHAEEEPTAAVPTNLRTYLTEHGAVSDRINIELVTQGGGETIDPTTGLNKDGSYLVNVEFSLEKGIPQGSYYLDIGTTGLSYIASVTDAPLKIYDQIQEQEVIIGKYSLTPAATEEDSDRLVFEFYENSNEYEEVLFSAYYGVSVKTGVSQIEVNGVRYEVTGLNVHDFKTKTGTVKASRSHNAADVPASTYLNNDYNRLPYLHWVVSMNYDNPGNNVPENAGHKYIVGSTVYDAIGTGHRMTDEDYAAGIVMTVKDGSGNIVAVKTLVKNDLDSGSNETGWYYTIPATITDDNGNTVTLLDKYEYDFAYFTTKTSFYGASGEIHSSNYFKYKSPESSDYEQLVQEYIKTYSPSVDDAAINKTLNSIGYDNESGKWIGSYTLEGAIPNTSGADKLTRYFVTDTYSVKKESTGWEPAKPEDAAYFSTYTGTVSRTVYMKYGESSEWIRIKPVGEATSEDLFTYALLPFSWRNDSDISEYVVFGTKCTCTEENCAHWVDGHCEMLDENGHCACFNPGAVFGGSVEFKIDYEIDETYYHKSIGL